MTEPPLLFGTHLGLDEIPAAFDKVTDRRPTAFMRAADGAPLLFENPRVVSNHLGKRLEVVAIHHELRDDGSKMLDFGPPSGDPGCIRSARRVRGTHESVFASAAEMSFSPDTPVAEEVAVRRRGVPRRYAPTPSPRGGEVRKCVLVVQ